MDPASLSLFSMIVVSNPPSLLCYVVLVQLLLQFLRFAWWTSFSVSILGTTALRVSRIQPLKLRKFN